MSDKDRIRDMVMALSRGDHEEAQAAANDVMAAKTTRITNESEADDVDIKDVDAKENKDE